MKLYCKVSIPDIPLKVTVGSLFIAFKSTCVVSLVVTSLFRLDSNLLPCLTVNRTAILTGNFCPTHTITCKGVYWAMHIVFIEPANKSVYGVE